MNQYVLPGGHIQVDVGDFSQEVSRQQQFDQGASFGNVMYDSLTLASEESMSI